MRSVPITNNTSCSNLSQPLCAPDPAKTLLQHLLLTCTHFNNHSEVMAFVTHITGLPLPDGWTLEIAICDNSNTWPSPDQSAILHHLPPNVTFYRSEVNRGYLNGCAYALQQWFRGQTEAARTTADSSAEEDTSTKGKQSDAAASWPTWVGVMNTDLLLDQTFFLNMLTSPLPEDTGCIAPEIRLSDGSRQNPFFRQRPSRTRFFAYTILYRSHLLTLLLQFLHTKKSEVAKRRLAQVDCSSTASEAPPARRSIYAGHGSAFFLHRRFFAHGGSLWYPGFMYGEELFVAEQILRSALRTVWVPQACLVHTANAATGRVPGRRKRHWMLESACILWKIRKERLTPGEADF